MKSLLFKLSALLILLLLPEVAVAAKAKTEYNDAGRGLFFSVATGFMAPLADDDYTDFVDVSFKLLFFRGGYLFKAGPLYLGPEIGVDFTPGNVDEDWEDPGYDLHLYRIRTVGGVRAVFPMPVPRHFSYRIRIIVRAGVGLDAAWGKWECDWPGCLFEEEDDSLGFALELGAGAEFMVHKRVALGLITGFPVLAFHGEDLFGRDYTSLELDFLIHVSIYAWP